MHKYTANSLCLLPALKELPPLIAAGPLVGALLAAPIRCQAEIRGERQVAPIREGRCAGKNQGNAESPVPGHTSCRTRLHRGERSTKAGGRNNFVPPKS